MNETATELTEVGSGLRDLEVFGTLAVATIVYLGIIKWWYKRKERKE